MIQWSLIQCSLESRHYFWWLISLIPISTKIFAHYLLSFSLNFIHNRRFNDFLFRWLLRLHMSILLLWWSVVHKNVSIHKIRIYLLICWNLRRFSLFWGFFKRILNFNFFYFFRLLFYFWNKNFWNFNFFYFFRLLFYFWNFNFFYHYFSFNFSQISSRGCNNFLYLVIFSERNILKSGVFIFFIISF